MHKSNKQTNLHMTCSPCCRHNLVFQTGCQQHSISKILFGHPFAVPSFIKMHLFQCVEKWYLERNLKRRDSYFDVIRDPNYTYIHKHTYFTTMCHKSVYYPSLYENQVCYFMRMPSRLYAWVLQATGQWTSYQVRKIAGCACAGNAKNVFPATAG